MNEVDDDGDEIPVILVKKAVVGLETYSINFFEQNDSESTCSTHISKFTKFLNLSLFNISFNHH